MLSWRYFLYIQSQEYISYFLISPVRPIRNMEWRVQEDRNVSYVGIENPFVKTFATVLLTSLVPDSPTWINFAFHRKAGRDIFKINDLLSIAPDTGKTKFRSQTTLRWGNVVKDPVWAEGKWIYTIEMNIHEKVVAPQQKNKRPPRITQEQGISSRPTNVTSESLRKQEEEENMVYVYV